MANRGEIALRVMRAATELEIETVAIFTRLDADALHTRSAGASVEVPSYLDTAAIVKAALDNDCDALHPGYGFLSESADLARSCEQAGLRFVGPTPATIALLGDKLAARRLAQHAGVPVANGSDQPCADAASVRAAMADLGLDWPVILKAVGGGGGRGVRPVHSDAQLETAFGACVREAAAVGAQGGVFVEELLREARHIEVQLLGDKHGNVATLSGRDCSMQRRVPTRNAAMRSEGAGAACQAVVATPAVAAAPLAMQRSSQWNLQAAVGARHRARAYLRRRT